MYKKDKICSVGLGYVGLPSATMFALYGLQVVGVDVNVKAVELINKGLSHIEEPDLDVALSSVVNEGKLVAQTDPTHADVFCITVPTPLIGETKEPDMACVISATKSIAPFVERGNLVILESTSPVGSTEMIVEVLVDERPDLDVRRNIFFAYCPERVLPGNTMRELIENSRVIGGYTPEAAEYAAEVFRTFCKGELVVSDCRTAELCKLVENSYRDVNCAFANELSMVCDSLGVDVSAVVSSANKHPRVNILDPGPGVGGHCLPIDPWFIASSCPDLTPLIQTARAVNTAKTRYCAKKIIDFCEQRGIQRLGVLGLSYKPNVDDPRESPSIEIVNELTEKVDVIVGDPFYACAPSQLSPAVEFRSAVHLDDVDFKIVLTEHSCFKAQLESGAALSLSEL